MNPLNNNNRANGFPVRCVQHLRRAVLFNFYRLSHTNCHSAAKRRSNTPKNSLPARNGRGQGSGQRGPQIPQSTHRPPCGLWVVHSGLSWSCCRTPPEHPIQRLSRVLRATATTRREPWWASARGAPTTLRRLCLRAMSTRAIWLTVRATCTRWTTRTGLTPFPCAASKHLRSCFNRFRNRRMRRSETDSPDPEWRRLRAFASAVVDSAIRCRHPRRAGQLCTPACAEAT